MLPETEIENNHQIPPLTKTNIPAWLTKQYMEKYLCNYQNDQSLKVHEMIVTPATLKGENYASIMNRIHIKYKTNNNRILQTASYIIKTTFSGNGIPTKIFQEIGVMNCEMTFYDQIIRKFHKILNEIAINDGCQSHSDKLFADLIAVDYDNQAIIFEDLTMTSYVMANRTDGLNIQHAKLALQKIAKMHAVSAVLNEREPGIFQRFDRGLFNRHTKVFQAIFCSNLKECAEITKTFGPKYQIYVDKMLKLCPELMERGISMSAPQSHHFNVLAHGDFWINNMMFQYDQITKQPTDLVMVDFQFCIWTSPAVDLHYFFNTSLNEELRLRKLDEFVQYYHNELQEMLVKLKFQGEIPSLHQFWIQYIEKSFFGFISACLVQPILINEDTADADMESLVGSDERSQRYRKTIYQNKKIQQNLKNLLPIYERQGLLDLKF